MYGRLDREQNNIAVFQKPSTRNIEKASGTLACSMRSYGQAVISLIEFDSKNGGGDWTAHYLDLEMEQNSNRHRNALI